MGAPTFACTPEAGGSPYPCSSADYQEMKRKDALYTEAEQVFRRLIAEDERVARIGGGDELTPEYKALLGNPDLREEKLAIIRADKADGLRAVGGEYRVAWIHRTPGASKAGSEVAVTGCVDLTSVRYLRKGTFETKGIQSELTLFLGFSSEASIVAVETKLGITC